MTLTRVGVSSSVIGALLASSLCLSSGPAVALSPGQDPHAAQTTASVTDAVNATRSARYVRYDAAVTVGTSRLTATGAADIADLRTSVVVHAGIASTEFRRVDDRYYVDARRLGATGARWVALDPRRNPDEVSARAIEALVADVSPQGALDALGTATSAIYLGNDSLGSRYRVDVAQDSASLVPLSSAFGVDQSTGTGRSTLDAWIDSQGRLTQVSYTEPGISWRFSLSAFGEAIDIEAPVLAETASSGSSTARQLFGTGMRTPATRVQARAITANPTVEIIDGVIQGNVNAVSTTGATLRLESLPSADGGTLQLGTIPGSGPQGFTVSPYANWLDGSAKGLQTFTVKITEVTRAAQYVEDLPLIGGLAASALDLLRTTPEASVQMTSTAGATTTAKISVRVDQLAPEGTPVAFTYRVPSFDGTLISTNFFPASGLAAETSAALALNGAGLGQPGSSDPYQVHGSDPYVPGVGTLRDAGYNVITWDPRGEFASGGILQLDNPFFEGRDVSALLDWAAALPEVQLNAPNDPVVGMVGGSYGGGIQLITASMDPRIDAIVPELAWNSLNESLSPNGMLNKQAASSLLASITSPSIRVNTLIRQGLKDSISRGKLSDTIRTLLTSNDMDPLLRQLQAPTLLVQSVVDALFPLNASIQNAQAIRANPYGTPVKMMWIDPANDDAEVAGGNVRALSILWLDKYIRGIPIPDAAIPAFQWWDQSGNRQTSTLLPFEPGFNQATPISATSTGGSLTFTSAKKPSTISLSAQVAAGAQIAGSPTMSFTYLGKGTARAVYVQVADASTKKVLGNVVTPIPVTLDGKQRTVSIPLGDLVFTANGASSLSITIMSSSSAFASSGTGRIAISNISVSIPKRSP